MHVSSPAATGSAGSAFETKVAAACLTLLLTRGAPLCLGAGVLVTVHLQAGHLGAGWCTDDLLLEAIDTTGRPIKAALQVKRSFKLSIDDAECVKTLRGALADFRNSAQFDKQCDVVAIVTSSLSATLARGLRTLLDCARASLSWSDMARRLSIPNYLGRPAEGYCQKIVEILAEAEGGAPTDDELWRFLCRLRVVDLDLNSESSLTETMLRTLLAATLPDGDPIAVDATWNELVTVALGDDSRAMSYTREKLPPAVLQRHGRANQFSHGISRLLEDSAVVLDGIRTTIADKAVIPRREVTGKLCGLIETSPLIFITGAAGSGKSALAKSAFVVAAEDGIGFAFRADSLAGSHINDVLGQRGLTLSGLQAQTAMHGKKLLLVESLERLMEKPPEQRTAFIDLLRKLKADPSWRLVITCRDYSAETVRTVFFNGVGVSPADIEVGELSDGELDDLAANFSALERPLGNRSLRRLLRNPFLLDKAAKMNWVVTEPLPTTERAFRAKVWSEVVQRVDEDLERGLPSLRGEVWVQVALRRAKALTPFVTASDLDSRALTRLVRDSLLQTPARGSPLYAPSHDVFEDWALMQWLDDAFVRHGRQLDSLLRELGTLPALRRAYRRWLTEALDVDPEATDPLVLALVQNPTVASHWREDTLVGVLQSSSACGFIERNANLLLSDDAKLLRQAVHILRVACRAAIPMRLFGIDAAGELFLPKGNGWIGTAQLMEAAIPLFKEADLLLIIGFLEDWMLHTKWGLRYPVGAASIANIAWHWLPKRPWRSAVRDAEERLLRVILAFPLAAEPTLTEKVEEALKGGENERSASKVVNLIFNYFACDAIVRDLPDLAFLVAEHLLSLDQPIERVIAQGGRDHWSRKTAHAFGFGNTHLTDDYPASAFHGPYLRMLTHHPSRGVDFLVRIINRAGDAYSHTANRTLNIEPLGTVTIHLPDGPHDQYANWPLFSAYRGAGGAPDCFESALMALEYWLLEKVKREDADLEGLLLKLLRRSNNVSMTAVVASVAAANPTLAGEAAFTLLTCRALLKADLERSVNDSFMPTNLGGLAMLQISAEKRLYQKERYESAGLEHRSRHLEYVAVILQQTERFQDRVWSLIDSFKSGLPAESDQDQETKIWRLQLHRLDIRNLVVTGRTEDGWILFGAKEPEPDLQAVIEAHKPRSAVFNAAVSLLNWGRSVFDGQGTSDEWKDYLQKGQAYGELKKSVSDETDFEACGPVYVAAVCIRNHWHEMTAEERLWCSRSVCDAVNAQADDYHFLFANSHTQMQGARPAAFVIPMLFGQELSTEIQMRLLPTLAKAVVNGDEQTVSYAMQGVGQFLWAIDRSLALTCVHALHTAAIAHQSFVERSQRQLSTESEFLADLCLRLRESILSRKAADEARIAAINFAVWPGRSLAKHVFQIATRNPNDPLLRQIMLRTTAQLPLIWKAGRRSHRLRNGDSEERYDPGVEHEFVDAICRFTLQLQPDEALTLLEPVFSAAPNFPGKAAELVTWLVIHQGVCAPAPTMWAVWQRFADNFAADVKPEKVDEQHSDEAKLLQELFLGVNWDEQRDWAPLHGEAHRVRAFFLRLPPMGHAFACYAYYVAKVGTPTLPDALVDISKKLDEARVGTILSERAIFYLEDVLTRMICGGNSRIRADAELRQATLLILDALVEAGSSPAYKLRDDFLTPAV